MQEITFDSYTVQHVNLTQFAAFMVVYRADRRSQWNRVVAAPSQAFKRSDGTLTVQSRTTDTGFKGYPMDKADKYYGIKPNGESVEVKFS